MVCLKCNDTGIVNIDDVPGDIREEGTNAILDWLIECEEAITEHGCSCHINPPCSTCVDYQHDVSICDCKDVKK